MRDYNYPIYFLDGTCVACGAPNSVVPINKFENIESDIDPIYPIYRMQCIQCGRIYGIKWKSSKGDNSSLDIPIPISKNYIDDFVEFVKKDLEQEKNK